MVVLACCVVFVSCRKIYLNDAGSFAGNETRAAMLAKNNTRPEQASLAAQSVQVNIKGVRKNYNIVSTQPLTYASWSYQWSERPEALAAFDTYFTVSTTGNPTADQVTRGKHKAFQDNKCRFWSGQPLAVSKFVCSIDNNRQVICTPKAPGQYAAKTGWTLEQVNGSFLTVTGMNIFIASASFVEKSKDKSGWSKKYSFSMKNDDGSSRLTNLKIELLRDGQVIETRTPAHTMEDGVNWHYEANAGIFGNPAAFYAFAGGEGCGRSVNSILYGELDDFRANDETGGTRALIADQTFSGITLPGKYAIRISGVVKGNSFEADKPFSVTQNLTTVNECEHSEGDCGDGCDDGGDCDDGDGCDDGGDCDDGGCDDGGGDDGGCDDGESCDDGSDCDGGTHR